MNTNSNSYTIIYASVMVVIVAFLLAFVSSFRTCGSNRVGSHKHGTEAETTENEVFVPRHFRHCIVFHADWVSGDTIFGMGQAVDGLTVATPLGLAATTGTVPEFSMDMVTGLIPGSIGETSVIAILIGAVILKKEGFLNYRLVSWRWYGRWK